MQALTLFIFARKNKLPKKIIKKDKKNNFLMQFYYEEKTGFCQAGELEEVKLYFDSFWSF